MKKKQIFLYCRQTRHQSRLLYIDYERMPAYDGSATCVIEGQEGLVAVLQGDLPGIGI